MVWFLSGVSGWLCDTCPYLLVLLMLRDFLVWRELLNGDDW